MICAPPFNTNKQNTKEDTHKFLNGRATKGSRLVIKIVKNCGKCNLLGAKNKRFMLCEPK